MRRLIFNRWTVLALLLLSLFLVASGDRDAAKFYLILSGFAWLFAGCPRPLRLRRRREPLAKITARAPFGKREAGLDGCFSRLDPQLRTWLASDTNRSISNAK